MEINSKDLKELAILVNKTMHSIEFPEDYVSVSYARKTQRFLDKMDNKYQKDTMLHSVRNAVSDVSANKMQFYKTARDLMKKVNAPDGYRKLPSNVEFVTIAPTAAIVPFRMSA